MIATRTDEVLERLRKLVWEDLHQGLSNANIQVWNSHESDKYGHAFGFHIPIRLHDRIEEQHAFTVPVCPELIANQTASLDDAEFGDYMDVLEFLICQMVQVVALGETDEQQVIDFVEAALFEVPEPARYLFSETQAASLG